MSGTRFVPAVLLLVLACGPVPALAGGHAGRSVGTRAAPGHGFVVVQRIPHARPSVFPTVVDPWQFWGVPPRFVHHGVVQRIPHARPSVFPTVVDPWQFWGVPPRFVHHGFRPRVPFVGFGYGSSIGYAIPAVYGGYDSASYGSSYAYAPGPAIATSVPSMPTVVEYPGGRYELRGDGVTVPYVWVWIPNPPLGPPATLAPPPAPPALEPSGGSPIAERASRAQRTRIYRWTDDQGVLNFTDDLENVPARYRTQASAR